MPEKNQYQPLIRVFSTEACPYCYSLKAFLEERGFTYEDINVGENVQAREEMVRKSGQLGVPVVEIDGEIIIGFDRGRISQILGIRE